MQIQMAGLSAAAELAQFFRRNVTPEYISHSELQSFRACNAGEWAADIEDVVRGEISDRLSSDFAAEPKRFVIEGRDEGRLVAMAMLSISRHALVPYGVLEDLVVDVDQRGRGLGEEMAAWIRDYALALDVRRLFLESGIGNGGPHHFFERIGFRPVSIVMMMELNRAASTSTCPNAKG